MNYIYDTRKLQIHILKHKLKLEYLNFKIQIYLGTRVAALIHDIINSFYNNICMDTLCGGLYLSQQCVKYFVTKFILCGLV